jgi:phosphatidylglycerol:prolipoprotein diacylglycerol transferase
MMPIFHLGPASIQTAALAFILALWVGAFIGEREARRRGLRGDDVWNALAIFIVATVVAGRLIYVAEYFAAYQNDWAEIFSFSPKALAVKYGAIVGGIATIAYVWRKKIPFARMADALGLGALVALAILALGQFFSGDGFGSVTNIPWGIQFLGGTRHPVQIYESILTLIGFIVIQQMAQPNRRDGSGALLSIAWYSAIRLFVDAFRADATLLPNGYRTSQVIALVVLLIALWAMMQMTTRNETQTNEGG